MKTKLVSKCCKTEYYTLGIITMYNVCKKCNKACDLIINPKHKTNE